MNTIDAAELNRLELELTYVQAGRPGLRARYLHRIDDFWVLRHSEAIMRGQFLVPEDIILGETFTQALGALTRLHDKD